MTSGHDRASVELDRWSEIAAPRPRADPLSDVLRTVRLKGALFFLVEATSPWCVEVPPGRDFAGIILPRARQVVSYHVVVEGSGLAGVPGSDPVAFEAGDIVVFPHADRYWMASEIGATPELDRDASIRFFQDLAAGRLPLVIPEGGGGEPRARFLCGFLGCDLSPCNPLFATLPRLLLVRPRPGGRADLLDRLIELAIAEAVADRVGGESIRLGLSELMFVEVLRRHLETVSSERPTWLTGLRDPVVGRALALLYAAPERAWTLDALACETGTSRSVLARRFAECTGETPMHYLALWRAQLAARLLADGSDKVAAVAERVGFGSEAAFSRAFKRATGQSPSDWRTASRA